MDDIQKEHIRRIEAHQDYLSTLRRELRTQVGNLTAVQPGRLNKKHIVVANLREAERKMRAAAELLAQAVEYV